MSEDAIGKTLLVGVTYLDADGEPVEQVQVYGRIVRLDDEVVEIETAQGERLTYPPQLEPAAPGEYRLRTTGEVVVDPDFLATWTVAPPADGATEA